MRPLDDLDCVEWHLYRGPAFFHPAEVPHWLRALGAVNDEPSRDEACNGCLSAFGNNHRGILYRAAVEAAPFLTWIAANGTPWARWAALEIIDTALRFSPDDEEYAPPDPGSPTFLRPADALFRDAIAADIDVFLSLLRDSDAFEELRLEAFYVLDQIAEPTRLYRELVRMGPTTNGRKLSPSDRRWVESLEEARLRWLREAPVDSAEGP